MKHRFLIAILSLSLSPAFGQSRVAEINQLGADYAATPPTVTFEVFWNTAPTPPRHRDTVWVFVDYQPVGTLGSWAPATITAAVVDAGAGTVIPGTLNGRGFYLDGHAGPVPFSSTLTVTLSSDLTGTKFNWCAYVSDYPPNATLGAGFYELHGTPPIEINGSITEPTRRYTGCITALTDATGCPGLIPPPPTAPILTAAPDSICAGDTTTLTATAGAASYSFDNGATWITANSATFSPTATTGYTIDIMNAAGCTATGAPVTVTVVPPPVPVFISPPATYCADSTFILTASAGSGSSYCFTQTVTGSSHNPYLTGNDTPTEVDCEFPTVEYCTPSGDSTFTVRMPESGSVTVCVRAWNAFGCYADTCVTIGATIAPVVALLSAQGTDVQTISLGQSLTSIITYGTTDATAVTVTGLPAGLGYTWNAPNVEITGTAAASATIGAHSYTVTATGNCGTTTTQGVITVAGEFLSMASTSTGSISLNMSFTGTMYIDWGDGDANTYTDANMKTHFYPGGSHTITAQATAINYLYGINSKLTALDVTHCSALTFLGCFSNQLTELDVSQNTALTNLQCSNNNLLSLNVSNNSAATLLDCSVNSLTALNVNANTALKTLLCDHNPLGTLDVSSNTALTALRCNNNQLDTLDVSNNTALTSLDCSSNSLASLDVSNNDALVYLHCYGNNLTSLSVSNNPALVTLQVQSNLFTVAALNALFGTLHDISIPDATKTVYICYNPKLGSSGYGNPGSATSGCTTAIAEGNGWTVNKVLCN
ncbi:MAG: hypothetical protein LBS12_05530 [Prevotellaceae bacterium]|jgi:hypothetical protein|nr:hypothetical protein [Prevotellaceae bacterium]